VSDERTRVGPAQPLKEDGLGVAGGVGGPRGEREPALGRIVLQVGDVVIGEFDIVKE
jgi:hypothetical protein